MNENETLNPPGQMLLSRVFSEVIALLIAETVCLLSYLACAATELVVHQLPFDVDHWGGYVMTAIIIVPQALLIIYGSWRVVMLFLKSVAYEPRWRDVGILGVVCGCGLWAIDERIGWIVPWMMVSQ